MRNIASTLLRFVIKLRRSGTSTLIQDIAYKHSCYIIVANETEKKIFCGDAISLADISTEKLNGIIAKPLLIDNYALIKLLEDVVAEQNKQEVIIRELTDKIKRYEQLN